MKVPGSSLRHKLLAERGRSKNRVEGRVSGPGGKTGVYMTQSGRCVLRVLKKEERRGRRRGLQGGAEEVGILGRRTKSKLLIRHSLQLFRRRDAPLGGLSIFHSSCSRQCRPAQPGRLRRQILLLPGKPRGTVFVQPTSPLLFSSVPHLGVADRRKEGGRKGKDKMHRYLLLLQLRSTGFEQSCSGGGNGAQ